MTIRNFFQRLDKKTKFSMATLVALMVVGVPAAVFAGYGPNGPDRVIYNFQDPAQREGAFDGPRFNSYINTNVYGDERAFLDAKECAAANDSCYTTGQAGGYKDQQPVEAGKEYIVRAYVHNIANPSINGTNNNGIGVAKNTHFRVEIPGGIANGFTLNATISADNSIPKAVYDTVDLRNDNQAFQVQYVPDSARIFNAAHPTGLPLVGDITSASGVQLGYNDMNGLFPGCFEFSSFVTIRVKIVSPNLKVTKRVTTPGSTNWQDTLTAKKGDTVSWLINYDVTNATAEDVTIRDTLPQGVSLVPGSIMWFDPNRPLGQTLPDTALGAGGVNVGNYSAGSGGAIRFRTVVNKDIPLCEAVNTAFSRAKSVPESSDTAKVVVENCQPSVPVYSCDGINKAFVSGRTYRFTTNATAQNGATVKQYRYTFTGSGYNQNAISNQANGQIDNTFPGPGDFDISVTVDFTVDGQTVSHTGNACKTTITIPKEKETPVVLPKTGPGDVVGIFAATTVAGAFVHRYILSRRYNS